MAKVHTYTNESFSGCDMVATILIPSLGNTPYAIGELQTISYSIHMDRQPVRAIGDINVKDYVMGPRTIAGSLVFAVFNKHFANRILKDVSNSLASGYSFLIDEIPPFNIVISAANEYGIRSKMVIYGVRLVNEGQVMSINDIYTENTYQFVATDVEYLNTDESSASSSDDGKSLYIIGSSSTENNENKVTTSISSVTTSPEIKYSILSISNKSRKGTVEVWVTPIQKNGNIIITGERFYASIDVATGLNGNNRIRLSLEKGEYQAYWSSLENKSNIINFSMPSENISELSSKAAPLIERITDSSITVLSNVSEHTKVIYMDEDGIEFSIKLSGKKAIINNLKSGHKYKIATCDIELKNKSKYAKATTLKFGQDEYKNFLDYLHYNKKYLDNENFDLYLKIVTEAKEQMYTNGKCNTIADSFLKVKKNYTKILNNLKTEDFINELEYNKEVKRIKELIAICTEITLLATNISNDSIYGYNYEVMAVQPPIPENNSFCTNTFIVQSNIESLDFYKNNNDIIQFAKKIKKNNFKKLNDEILCNFNGRPNMNHYTYAINEYGYKSPRVDFYTLSDEERILALNKYQENMEHIQYELNRANNLYGCYLNESFSDEETKRVLTEIIKNPDIKNIRTPSVMETTNNSVVIKIDEVNSEHMVVISDIDNALLNVPRYKTISDELVTFSIENHGLKHDKEYIVWVEKNGVQISNSISFKLSEKTEYIEQNEYNAQEYFLNEITQNIKNILEENNLSSNFINTLIDKNKNELSSNKSNILDNILNDLISESSLLSNYSDILYYFFVTYLENFYTLNNNFFETDVVIDSISNTIIVPRDCIVDIFNINNDKCNKISYLALQGEAIDLNNQAGQYSIISFVENDYSKRSGFIFSKNLINTYSAHKIQVKVGE